MWTTPHPRREARHPAGPRPAPAATGVPAAGDDDVDHADAADLLHDAPDADADQASAAQARLLEAFPGASEVAG